MTNYTNIKIPEPMAEKVEEIIKEYPELGYTNKTQFIVNAIRIGIKTLSPEFIFPKST